MKRRALLILVVAFGVDACASTRNASQIQGPRASPTTTSSTTATSSPPTPGQVLPFSPHPDFAGPLPDGMWPAWPQLHVALHLQETHAKSGTPIAGELLVTNDGSQPIARAPGRSCSTTFVVALESPTYTPDIAWTAAACTLGPGTPEPVWPPGLTTIPFTIITTYNGCGGQPQTIPCAPHGGPPALPSGTYHTFVDSNGMALPQPAQLTVTLT